MQNYLLVVVAKAARKELQRPAETFIKVVRLLMRYAGGGSGH